MDFNPQMQLAGLLVPVVVAVAGQDEVSALGA